jgi:hypothetical protein
MLRLRSVELLTAALLASRGLFAQAVAPRPSVIPVTAEELRLSLRPPTLAYAVVEPMLFPPPEPVKALYINAWAFSSSRLWRLIELADSTEINAFVIDVKDDTGCLLYRSQVATARQIGASACARLASVGARLDSVRLHDIRPIARIVVAKDPLLANGKTAWAVRHRDGGLWRDRIDMAWVDAFNDSVWIYAAQLAAEAVRLGFAEVQFDYVRFPDEPRSRMATAVFGARRDGESQRAAVRRNVRLLKERLAPLGVPVTFDIFGLTATYDGDMGIGQVWEDFVDVADVMLPMVYPSHYYAGAYGYQRPNHHPYQIVRNALRDAQARTPVWTGPEIRPYLQAFTLGRRKPRYTPHEIREQIRAAEELGIFTWVLWNPRSVYQRDALRPSRGAPPVTDLGELSAQ